MSEIETTDIPETSGPAVAEFEFESVKAGQLLYCKLQRGSEGVQGAIEKLNNGEISPAQAASVLAYYGGALVMDIDQLRTHGNETLKQFVPAGNETSKP